MYHSFERIISDTMYACEAYNSFTNDNNMVLDNDLVSDCCGTAVSAQFTNGDITICPDCLEHCEVILS